MAGVSFKAKLTGLDDVHRAMRAVEAKIQKKIQRKALTEAMKPIAKAGKEKCPVDTSPHNPVKGLLKKSLGTKTKTYRGSGIVVIIFGARTNFRRQVGTRTRGTNKGKPFYQDPAKIAAPHPFMRPAYDENKSKAEAEFARVVREELEK